MLGNSFRSFFSILSSADFFQNELFQNILSGTLSECQTVWTQIKINVTCSVGPDQFGFKLFAKVISRPLARKENNLEFMYYTQVLINKHFQRKIVNIFLPISFNICCGCSKEPSH